MAIILWYVAFGSALLFALVNDVNFLKNNLLNTFGERLVFIWAWPAMLFVMLLFPLCRAEDSDPAGTL